MRVGLVAAAVVLVLLPPAAPAQDAAEAAPGAESKGKVFTWKSKGGLAYEYFVPASYDPQRGANLVFVFHGTGLDRRWTFANHPAGEFRPDDIVVSPDGPVPDRGARLYAYSGESLEAIRALQTELQAAFKVRAVYLYGHSQGAFFAFLYASKHPADVQGALGHAGGVLKGIECGKAHAAQAYLLLHGTADPVVPYGNSRGGWDWYREQGHGLAHLRSLEGWPHAPEHLQAGQALAWLEGMTAKDPERVAAAHAHFAGWPDRGTVDFAAWHAVAKRLAAMEGAPADAKERAAAAVQAIESLAERHAAAIRDGAGKEIPTKTDGKPWLGHFHRFLRDFAGVPAREALAKEWAAPIGKHRDRAVECLRDFWRVRGKDAKKAFEEGVGAVRDGFLHWECADPMLLDALGAWARDARTHRIDPAAVKAHGQIVDPFRDSLKSGLANYNAINAGP